MNPTQKRFTPSDRFFHLGLIITFLIQSATGLGQLTMMTPWGSTLVHLMGGYEKVVSIHYIVGIMMTFLFLIHGGETLFRMGYGKWFGPDSLLFSWRDLRHMGTNVKWILGMGSPARLGRWSYWEKFDYWAVFWGMPILSVTGIMLYHAVDISRYIPGWGLNIAGLLHRAEAILAMVYIFGIHFFMGHLRPSAFPMNPSIFTGEMPLSDLHHEKPAWAEELKSQGILKNGRGRPASPLFKTTYAIFGFTAVAIGLYLLIHIVILIGRMGL